MKDDLLKEWHRTSTALLPPDIEVWDAHTHTGQDDPDGVTGTDEELLTSLEEAGHAGAVVFTSMNPAGYGEANDRILAEAVRSGGRLIPYLRVDPTDAGALREVERGIDRGHRGIKLHPRAEDFRLGDHSVTEIAGVAAKRGLPIIVHAGRGTPALGEHAIRLVSDIDRLHLILAHAAISDLAAIGPVAADHPRLFFDTAWWNSADLLALFAWVPPGQILYASDTPYGSPLLSSVLAARAAIAAAHGAGALRAIFGDTLRCLVDGGKLPDPGIAPGEGFMSVNASLLRVFAYLHAAVAHLRTGRDAAEALSLAGSACNVPAGDRHEHVHRAIAATLARAESMQRDRLSRRAALHLVLVAASAALTPEVPVPEF